MQTLVCRPVYRQNQRRYLIALSVVLMPAQVINYTLSLLMQKLYIQIDRIIYLLEHIAALIRCSHQISVMDMSRTQGHLGALRKPELSRDDHIRVIAHLLKTSL